VAGEGLNRPPNVEEAKRMSVDIPTAPPDPPASPPPPEPGAPAPFDDSRVRLVAILVAVGACVLLGIALFGVLRGGDDGTAGDAEAAGPYGAFALDGALPRPDFTLTDVDGRPYDFAAETGGRLTLLFFGYTNCPDICPTQMSTLAASLDEPHMPEPIVVFVTTDPARDTPERLRDWLGGFDIPGDVVGLTGSPEEIAAAEQAAAIPGSSIDPEGEGDDDYLVAHAAQIMAYTPDDAAHAAFPSGVRREDWMQHLPALMDDWREA
jgi:protein SCO1